MSDAPRSRPLDLHQWITDNADAFQPPVSNKVVWKDSDQTFMVIHGPNARSDFHVDPFDEVFMQLKGSIRVDLMIDGIRQQHWIHEGQVMLVPANVPHSPRRPPDTWGVVIERPRGDDQFDSLVWFCDVCGEETHRVTFHLREIETATTTRPCRIEPAQTAM
jgi:3-hydroxyanthranilate 3,4-dioxygenase